MAYLNGKIKIKFFKCIDRTRCQCVFVFCVISVYVGSQYSSYKSSKYSLQVSSSICDKITVSLFLSFSLLYRGLMLYLYEFLFPTWSLLFYFLYKFLFVLTLLYMQHSVILQQFLSISILLYFCLLLRFHSLHQTNCFI